MFGDVREFCKFKKYIDSRNPNYNEKSTILFNEMVRLGKDSEAQQQRLLSVQQGYEDRIVQLESRLMQSE